MLNELLRYLILYACMIIIEDMQQKSGQSLDFEIQKRFINANDFLLFSDRLINNETDLNKILHLITWSFFLISVFRDTLFLNCTGFYRYNLFSPEGVSVFIQWEMCLAAE